MTDNSIFDGLLVPLFRITALALLMTWPIDAHLVGNAAHGIVSGIFSSLE